MHSKVGLTVNQSPRLPSFIVLVIAIAIGAGYLRASKTTGTGDPTNREINAVDDSRKIHITETLFAIKMIITSNAGAANESSKTYTAQDAADLQQQNPDAYKLYEK